MPGGFPSGVPVVRVSRDSAKAAPAHLRIIMETIASGRGQMLRIVDASVFDVRAIPSPWICFFGDDFGPSAVGPNGFHQKSLKRALLKSDGAIIVACAPYPKFYNSAAIMLMAWKNVFFVETNEYGEADWVNYVTSNRPGFPCLVGAVRAAGSA